MIFIILLGLFATPARAQSIPLRIPDTTAVAWDTVEIPVYADQDLSGLAVISWQLEIGFNETYLEPLAINKQGTLSEGWSNIQLKYWVPGKVSIAAAGGTPLAGAGKLIWVRFRCIKAGSSTLQFTDPSKNLLNEGDPPVTLDNGSLLIKPRPVITVKPETGLLTSGEELQYSVQGGTPPYAWSVTLDSVASIGSDGLLTAGKRGFTRVIAEDSEGIIDTSGLLEVRGFKLSIPDTSGWQANEISIPVNASDLSSLGIVSGLVRLSWPQNIMDAVVDVETGGTILQGTADIQVNTGIPGTVSVSFAGTTPLSGSGPLFYVTYLVSRNTGGAYLEITEAMFNQDIGATTQKGYFTIKPLPDLSVTPEKASLLTGESVTFTAGGGFPPYAWDVSNPAVANIDASGEMSALRGGILFVSVSDQIGAEGRSDTIFVYDAEIFVPDTSAELNTTFDLPVYIGELPSGSMDISAIEADLTLRVPELEVIEIITQGSLTEGWLDTMNVENDSIVHLALAGSTGFNSPGTLFFLRVRLTEEFTVLEQANIWINRILLNEGLPAALPQHGSITGFALGEDLGLQCTTNLSDGCELPVPVEYTLTILNNGGTTYNVGDTLLAGLIIPDEDPVAIFGILESALPPAGSVELVFRDTVDASFTGTFAYRLYTDLEEDINRNNDTIRESFTIYGYPEVDLGEPQTVVSSFPYPLDAGPGMDSYEWQDGSTGQNFSATDYGQYWVHVMRNGCPGGDTINLIGVGVFPSTAPGMDLKVMPNPSNGIFRLTSQSMRGWIEIGVYNLLGQGIYRERIFAGESLDHTLRLGKDNQGPFLLKVNGKVVKIIIHSE